MILLSPITFDATTNIPLYEGDREYTITIQPNIYRNETSGLIDMFYSVHFQGEPNPVIESWLGEIEQEANSDEPHMERAIQECILSQYGQMDRDELQNHDIVVQLTPLNDGFWLQWNGVSMSIDMETQKLCHCSPLEASATSIQAIRIGKTVEALLREIYPYDFEDVLEVAFNQTFECSLTTMFHYESLKKDVDIVLELDQLHQLKVQSPTSYPEQPLYV